MPVGPNGWVRIVVGIAVFPTRRQFTSGGWGVMEVIHETLYNLLTAKIRRQREVQT